MLHRWIRTGVHTPLHTTVHTQKTPVHTPCARGCARGCASCETGVHTPCARIAQACTGGNACTGVHRCDSAMLVQACTGGERAHGCAQVWVGLPVCISAKHACPLGVLIPFHPGCNVHGNGSAQKDRARVCTGVGTCRTVACRAGRGISRKVGAGCVNISPRTESPTPAMSPIPGDLRHLWPAARTGMEW